MIPNERLQEIVKGYALDKYVPPEEALMAQELLTIRAEIARLKEEKRELIEWAEYWYERKTGSPHWAGAPELAEAEKEYTNWMARVKGE